MSSAASGSVTQFGTKGEGAGQLVTSYGAALNTESGALYLTDRTNSRVSEFGGEGEFLKAWGWGVADRREGFEACTATCFEGYEGSGAGEFNFPGGVAVDNDPLSASHGDVYVADVSNQRVEKFEADGTFLAAFGGEVNRTKDEEAGSTAAEKDVCTAASGDECVAGVPGSEPGQFELERGGILAVDSSGTVYVGDANRVQELSEAGGILREIRLPGAGSTTGVAVDTSGDVYVSSSALPGIRRYEGCSTACTGKQVGTPRDIGGEPRAFVLDAAGDLFVDDERGGHHILGYRDSGTEFASFDGGGPESLALAWSDATKTLYAVSEGLVRLISQPSTGPAVVREATSELQPTTATLQASLNPEGAGLEYRFEYGTTSAYGESTPATPLGGANEVQLVSLSASGGTFEVSFGAEQSAEVPFNATAAELGAALEGILAIGAGGVAVSGEPGGPWSVEFVGAHADEDLPELSVNTEGIVGPGGEEPSASVTVTEPGISLFEDRATSASITGLAPGTTYHFRVVVTNASNETIDGPDMTFSTLPAALIESEGSRQVTDSSARLDVDVNPLGLATEVHFEYGPTSAYGSQTPTEATGSGSGKVPISAMVVGLAPGTTYHFRAIARNMLGEVSGPDRTFTTEGSREVALLDGRAWEMVSPTDKKAVSLEMSTEEGGILQASAAGDAITYFTQAPIDDAPAGNRSFAYSQQLSRRVGTEWSTEDLATAQEEIQGLTGGGLSEYKQFSDDLSTAALEPQGATPLAPGATERTPYLWRSSNPGYLPLLTTEDVAPGVKWGGTPTTGEGFGGGSSFVAGSSDLRHVLLSAPVALTGGFEAAGNESLYEWTAGVLGRSALKLVSVLPDGEPTAALGAGAAAGNRSHGLRHFMSPDGNRVVFSVGLESGFVHLYLRDVAGEETLQLDAPEEAAKNPGIEKATFVDASTDLSKVFFLDTARLTLDSHATRRSPELYMCEVVRSGGSLACKLKDLSVPMNAGELAEVISPDLGVDESGRLIYFVANGILAAGAEHGDCEETGQAASVSATARCSLYMVDTTTGESRKVATLSNRDAPDWQAGPERYAHFSELTLRVSANGSYVAFMSQLPLTGYDNRDAVSGQPDEEVFLYDEATSALRCVSCNPTGGRPHGVFDPNVNPASLPLLIDRPDIWAEQWLAGSLPGWPLVDNEHALHEPRNLFNDGRLFFDSADALVPNDNNGQADVYEYEPAGAGSCTSPNGCVGLMSSGESTTESAFVDASATGDDVFMMTAAKLVKADTDAALDIYDSHVCTEASSCPGDSSVVSQPCSDIASCRSAPAPVAVSVPASSSSSSSGNVVPAPTVTKPKSKPLTRAQKLKRALKVCKPKHGRARSHCERAVRKRYGHRPAKRKR